MSDVIPSSQTLPDGFCPTTWQDTLDEFAASMRVHLPDSLGEIVISQTTPAPADNAKIWFKVDANNHVVGVYSYSSLIGGWQLAADYPYYFQDLGTADAISITTGENIALNVDLQGRFFFVRIANANLTTAPTFQVDIAPVTAIKKYGATAIAAGDFASDMIAILIFDGTQFQFLNPVISVPASQVVVSSNSTSPLSLPAVGDVVNYAHTLGVVPTFYSADFICVTPNNGYAAGAVIPFDTISCGGSNDEQPAFNLMADDTNLSLVQENGTFPNRGFLKRSAPIGSVVAFVQAEWNVIFTATLLTN